MTDFYEDRFTAQAPEGVPATQAAAEAGVQLTGAEGLPVADERTRSAQAYGTQYSCGNCDSDGGGMYRVRTEPTLWWIGLDRSGQAHYLCSNCHPAYFASQPLIEPAGCAQEGPRG